MPTLGEALKLVEGLIQLDQRLADCRCGNIDLTPQEKEAISVVLAFTRKHAPIEELS